MNSLQDIERAIDGLTPHELAELYAWLDRHRPLAGVNQSKGTVIEQGLGLFGNPEDAALLDEVVQLAYEERHRSSRRPNELSCLRSFWIQTSSRST